MGKVHANPLENSICNLSSDPNEQWKYHQKRLQNLHHHFRFLVMPHSLMNAPLTFQALMNHIFFKIYSANLIWCSLTIFIIGQFIEDYLDHVQ